MASVTWSSGREFGQRLPRRRLRVGPRCTMKSDPYKPGRAEAPVTQEQEPEPLKVDKNLAQGAAGLWTTYRDGAVLLRLSKHGPGHEIPVTIPELFQESVDRFGAYPALATKNSRSWDTLSFSQYYEACRKAAKALIKLGLERFHGVGILGFNSVEWFIAALGAIMAGGLCVGIYATNSSEACHYVITHAKVDILLVENDLQLRKILSIPQDGLETLKAIIQYKEPMTSRDNLYCWDDFMELGNYVSEVQLDRIILSQRANQCAVLIYTSGTVGKPKGVMLSHDNITWMAGAMVRDLGLNEMSGKQEMVVSYLPLSHIAAQMMDIWIPIKIGALTFFAQPDALKGTLVSTLQEVKPTAFLGVPRIWEKIHDTIEENIAKSSGLKKKAFAWAKLIGLKVNTQRMLGKRDIPVNYRMAKALVFSKVKHSLGLDRCHSFVSGAAPLTQETCEFFLSLDIPICEFYGMSETSGPHTYSNSSNYRVLSCGKILSGCKNMLFQPNKDGIGEVCMWGRHVFMGYLEREEATADVIDEEGWLHSGDLGRMDNQGFLFITGRIKEILITAGGENVPPIPIETLVKEKIPIVSNAMLVGDGAKFLSLLLTLKCQMDQKSGEPLDNLSWDAIDFCQSVGSQAKTVRDIVGQQDPLVYKAIQQGIDAVNQEATSNAQRIRKWLILDKDFSIQGGELGPTTKMRRHFIIQKYKPQIDTLYC
ncbi:long-chain-fatty-acid--CoA ligase ACSBG2-like [Dipodomys spectabilis]|uniref:long-chain-fatty-acid--CoA ligase ACSBG2-like n=1 Tax=Dipodomys spectabilis TaxID=105255 RepID=UPI001C537330|nr:long-chain-fatty-acid--CoA ligase ACSBG2-like [Dipodomys spectabilis]